MPNYDPISVKGPLFLIPSDTERKIWVRTQREQTRIKGKWRHHLVYGELELNDEKKEERGLGGDRNQQGGKTRNHGQGQGGKGRKLQPLPNNILGGQLKSTMGREEFKKRFGERNKDEEPRTLSPWVETLPNPDYS